jgi:hypothetical protein
VLPLLSALPPLLPVPSATSVLPVPRASVLWVPSARAHARCRRPALQRHLLADITVLVVPALRPVR